MGWRKIQTEDIKRGTVIRMTNLNDGSYNMATIIGVEIKGDTNSTWSYCRVARPMAYAHEHFDSRSPLLYAEVFEIGIDRMLSPSSDVEVFQARDEVRSMAT